MRSFVQAPFILFLAASAASAASNLKITSKGPESVADVGDLKVTLTVTNMGQEPVKILHEPNGAMSNAATDKFIIANEQNNRPQFQGIKAKYAPHIAAASGQYTELRPGEQVTTEHNVADAYDFVPSGAGRYTFHPKEILYVVDSSGKVQTVSADTEDHVTKVAGNSAKYSTRSTAKASLVKKNSQEIGFKNCTAEQQPIITAAVPNAVKYIHEASSYLKRISWSTDRYYTWFGTYTNERKNLVQRHFENIGESPYSVTYDCSTCPKTMDHSDDTFAYVQPNDPTTIYLCGAFWKAPATGSDSQAGTIVHESTHFIKYAGTDDIAYGEELCQKLAQDKPEQAVMNADSHEYFAENHPYRY